MLKNILKLEGAQELTKNAQKSIKGGLACGMDGYCPRGSHCSDGQFPDPEWSAGLCRAN